ncbi:hypothetical protein [Streptomyces sp. PT12]|uniref:hypothetical protein n=1 Tax=Streptomyces sp. PT12 TaxID=1510197 RepID=UPI0011BF9C8E|nr:hypothetical protein [Streptomyces sp. PT12]
MPHGRHPTPSRTVLVDGRKGCRDKGGDRDATRLTARVNAAVERLTRGGDVSLGRYVKGTVFHSVALVTRSPHHTHPALACPARSTTHAPRSTFHVPRTAAP